MRETIYVVQGGHSRRQYGCLAFLGDVFMTFLTGGLWLIWIFVREMRK